MYPSVPPTHFRREKLYPDLHKNNQHFKLAFQSKRIIIPPPPAYVQAESAAIPENMKGRARGSRDRRGTRHKRLTLSSLHFRIQGLICGFIAKYNWIYSKTDFCRGNK